MLVTYNVNPIIIYMLPISLHHEDGLFHQLQINILLKYMKKLFMFSFAMCSYTLPV